MALGPLGDASSEHPMHLVIKKRFDQKGKAGASVQMIQDENVREAIEILQSFLQARVDFDGPGHADSSRRLNGHTFDLFDR